MDRIQEAIKLAKVTPFNLATIANALEAVHEVNGDVDMAITCIRKGLDPYLIIAAAYIVR